MKSFASLLLGLGLFTLALTSCSSPPLRGVAVNVTALSPADPAQLKDELTLTLRYYNETIVPYGISGSRHKLSLNGRYVGKADNRNPLGIPPQQTALQQVVVKLDHPEEVRQLLSAASGSIAYQLDTVLSQTIDEDKSENKIHSSGTIDLRPSN